MKLRKALTWFQQRSLAFRSIVGLAMVVAIGVFDTLTGPEIGSSIFYLAPVVLVSWTNGRYWGVFMSMVGGLVWFGADQITGQVYTHPLIPYWNMTIRVGFFVITALLLARLKLALVREQELSRTDSLTGVNNSRHFLEIANGELERCRRYGRPLTLVYIDLDNFKAVNDSLGHITGDSLLREVARCIGSNVRKIDLVARLGGDEFAVLLPETGFEEASFLLYRLQGVLLGVMRDGKWPVTFSMGAATFVTMPSSVEEIIREADRLMYSVKNSGKNSIRHELIRKTASVSLQ